MERHHDMSVNKSRHLMRTPPGRKRNQNSYDKQFRETFVPFVDSLFYSSFLSFMIFATLFSKSITSPTIILR